LIDDLREMGFWFGRWYFAKWWAVSLLPRSLARLISRVRGNLRPRASRSPVWGSG
jgi:hypothetical protein